MTAGALRSWVEVAGSSFAVRERAHRIDPVGFAGVGTKFGTKLSPEDIVEEATWAISGLGAAWPSLAYGAAQESNLPSVGLRRRTGFEDQLGHRPQPLRA